MPRNPILKHAYVWLVRYDVKDHSFFQYLSSRPRKLKVEEKLDSFVAYRIFSILVIAEIVSTLAEYLDCELANGSNHLYFQQQDITVD